MSTPRTPNQKKQYAALNARLNKYAKLIEQLYTKYNREAAAIALRTDYIPDGGKMFRFKDYPQTRAAINDLLLEYANDIVGTIHRGTAYEWQQSNTFQDLLANKVLRAYGISNPKTKEYQHYFQTNSDHLKAFQQRQISGMNLSGRVWDLRSQYKEELEMALSVGIEQGISANALASQMKKYLNNPDQLFRRVRDEFGNLQLSKNAKAYHPGRGVYRSSFKNAQRLTRSEINMAYRTAEQERWRQFDFVVGYEIKLSQRHPCHDVCDELAGRYPKDFVWTGWHPNDMCYAVSILKTDDEFWRDLEQDPDEPKEPSINEITDVPDGFKEWVAENADRIEAAEMRGTQPYFIRDNREAVDEVLKPREAIELAIETGLTPMQKNMQELADALGVTQGAQMSFDEANEMRGNPNYKKAIKYRVNCQSSVLANELRRRGFDVEAYGNTKEDWYMPSVLAKKPEIAFVDANGDLPTPIAIRFNGELISSLGGEMKETGRYHLRFRFANGGGHIITAERLSDGSLRIYDPQNGKLITNFTEYTVNVKNDSFEYYRVDNLQINPTVAKGVVKVAKTKGDAPRMQLAEITDFLEKGWYGSSSKNRAIDEIREIQQRWNERKSSQNTEQFDVIVHPDRRAKASVSKQEKMKFDKEYRMATTYSSFGHRVEMLQEISGVSSPDAIIDGVKVDFKSLSSANNIERHAKNAIFKQGADEVWFEFTNKSGEIINKIERLQNQGIHGRFYIKGEGKEYRF